MAARIVHFGLDECSRVLVLQRAGYDVEVCPDSLPELVDKLRETTDAVVVSETGTEHFIEAASVTHTISPAPVVLFKDAASFGDDPAFDIIIPALTPPTEWLRSIAEVIERSHRLGEQSQLVRAQSAQLCLEAADIRAKSEFERARAQRARARINSLLKSKEER